MIKITDDYDVWYTGEEEESNVYFYPCESWCEHRRLVKKKELIHNPGLWSECSICQYFIPADLYKRKRGFYE